MRLHNTPCRFMPGKTPRVARLPASRTLLASPRRSHVFSQAHAEATSFYKTGPENEEKPSFGEKEGRRRSVFFERRRPVRHAAWRGATRVRPGPRVPREHCRAPRTNSSERPACAEPLATWGSICRSKGSSPLPRGEARSTTYPLSSPWPALRRSGLGRGRWGFSCRRF